MAVVTQPQQIGASMNLALRSLCEKSEPPTDAERVRLETAFKRWNDNLREVHHWTPEMLAERWALFSWHCRQMWKEAGVPRHFANIDLFRLDKWLPSRYATMANVLLTLRDKPQLIAIGGPRGRGKTGMACGLIRAYCRLGLSCLYARARDFFDAIDGVPWQEKPGIKERFVRPKLLVLDEVQVRDSGKSWQDNDLTTLIDRRYGDDLCTVLLSNLQPEPLIKNLGDSVQRRLNEQGQILEADWPELEPLRIEFERKVSAAMS